MKHLLPTILLFSFAINHSFSQEIKNWTIIYYAVGSNSSEEHLLSDIAEMKTGKKSTSYHLITLVDRVEGHSDDAETLDGNFIDTRLYQIEQDSYERLDGKEFFPEISSTSSFEANMADVRTLQKFIQYCKKYYPANNYMLVLRSHGNGVSMCPDAESGERDRIYPAEMTKVLTEEESVDILGLDVCSMAGLENLYQWRPGNGSFSADYVLASAPLSGAWAYDQILNRLLDDPSKASGLDDNYFEGGKEQALNPATMTALDFSKLIFEEIYDSQRWCSWGLFDNGKIKVLKEKIDQAAQQLAEEPKEILIDIVQSTLGYHHNTSDDSEVELLAFPYVDAYHFWSLISANDQLKAETKSLADKVCQAIDALVIHSYYGRGFLPETDDFEEGKTGAYLIIPQGHKIFSQSKQSFWSHCSWFHPADKSGEENSFGQYDWCIDGAISANQQVDNFYEFLDFLFDSSNGEKGGVNAYQW